MSVIVRGCLEKKCVRVRGVGCKLLNWGVQTSDAQQFFAFRILPGSYKGSAKKIHDSKQRAKQTTKNRVVVGNGFLSGHRRGGIAIRR